ncbi:MAG: IS110 family transposase [Oscillospiraceae bacterium]|jgi:transposase|nr:IS110 family transposase [Oscillospiraceae bacterium]
MKDVLQARIEAITTTTLIVGIDAAKDLHYARITDYRGLNLSKPVPVNNSIDGFESLQKTIERLKKKHSCDKVIIGMEPSGHYWRAMGWHFMLDESKPVMVGVNPYHVKQTREFNDNSPTKSDPKDALIIANLIRQGQYFDMYLPEDEYADLRILNGERQRLMKQVSRANNIIVAVMDEFFPEYGKIWGKVTCPTSRDIMKEIAFPDEVLATDKNNFRALVKKASNGTEGDKLMNELINAATVSVGVREGLKSAKTKLVRLIEELEYFERRVFDLETELDAVMKTLELDEILQSMKGIGSIISAGFIGEIGDVVRFDSWKQVRKLAGLNLVENSSGQHIGKTKISKRGRPYLRHMLFMAGESCFMHNTEMKQYYYYLRRRSNNPLGHYQALIAVGLKVMRIMFYMAKNKEKYNPDKALGEVRLNQIASVSM